MNKRNSLFLAFVFLLLFACSKYPKDVLNPNDMVDVLYDIQIAQSLQKNGLGSFESNADKDALINYVLDKHGVTEAELDSSLVWYSDNPDLYVKVHDKVIGRLTEKRDEYDKIARVTDRSKRSNMPVIPFFYLTRVDPVFRFSLDSAKVEEMGGDVVFSLKALGVNPDIKVYGDVAFEFTDTILYVTKTMKNNISYTFKKPSYPLGLKRVSGYIKSDIPDFDSNILLYDMKIVENNE